MSSSNASSSQEQPLMSSISDDILPGAPFYEGPLVKVADETKKLEEASFGWNYFFKPLSVYAKNRKDELHVRFRGIDEKIPLLLSILLGLQHAAIAYGNVVLPALLLAWGYPNTFGKYALQSAFIVSGLGSLLQCMQIKIPGTRVRIGTGLCSFVGNSYLFGTITLTIIGRLVVDEGVSPSDAYGKVLGTAVACSPVFVGLSLIPWRYVRFMFPPVVSGVIIILVGFACSVRGYQYWGGGMDCADLPIFCQFDGDILLPFGSSEYMGFGFMVVGLLLLTELFGTAFMRQNSVAFSMGIPFALAAVVTRHGKHYVTGDFLDVSNPIDFLWTTTYKLGFDKYAVLPLIGAYLVTYLQSVAVLTGTLEESKMDLDGTEADERIQGGLISTGLVSVFSVFATGLPVAPYPENNSFLYMSRIASRVPAMIGAFVLLSMGIFGHLVAIGLEVPIVIRGGLVVPLSMTIVLGGFRILGREKLNQRNSLIVVYALTCGLGSLLVPQSINPELWPTETDASAILQSISFAVVSMLQVPFFLGGFAAITLNLTLPKEVTIGEIDYLPE